MLILYIEIFKYNLDKQKTNFVLNKLFNSLFNKTVVGRCILGGGFKSLSVIRIF